MGEGDWQFLKYSPPVGSRDSHMILRTFQATAADEKTARYWQDPVVRSVPWGRKGTMKVASHYFRPHGQEQDNIILFIWHQFHPTVVSLGTASNDLGERL